MTNPADNLFSDPSVQFLQKLLEDIKTGYITLPRFQRPLVWDKARRLELFDSVRRGIPIGSLLIWETRALADSDTQIIPKTNLGPFLLPEASQGSPRRYLLDGEQRLMTLYFALHRPELGDAPDVEEGAPAYEVFFDLEKQEFVTKGDLGEAPGHQHFPLREIFVHRGVLRFQRALESALSQQLGPRPSPEQRQTLDRKMAVFVESSDMIAEAIRQYKIPVTLIATDSLEIATETFKRINSQGVPMSEVHMMNAIAWRKSFDMLAHFEEIRQSIEAYPLWQDDVNLSDDVVLRVAKRLLGRGVYDEDVSAIAPRLRDDAILRRVGESMERCAKFLAFRGLCNPGHVPHELQLVVLGKVFDEVPAPSETALERLEDWLWYTSYVDAFGGVARESIYRAMEAKALSVARGDAPTAPLKQQFRKPLPSFDFRRTRSRALAWMFARRMMPHDEGNAADVLAASGSGALVRIAKPTNESMEFARSSALRVLSRPEDLTHHRTEILNGRSDEPFREAQVLSPEACEALRKKDVPNFARIRERELNAMEERKFNEVSERLFGDSPGLDALDE